MVAGDNQQVEKILQEAFLHFEKCELAQARECFLQVLRQTEHTGSALVSRIEAVCGLLRHASEALNPTEIDQWDQELDRLMRQYPGQMPPSVWYCKAVIAHQRENWLLCQRSVRRYLRALRSLPPDARAPAELEREFARGYVAWANSLLQRGRVRRAAHLAEQLLARVESKKLRGINGVLHLTLGTLCERAGQPEKALEWFKKAHAAFLEEHNWYHHLYALYGYARVARIQKQYAMAHWYLDLIEKAANTSDFGLLRREITRERKRLEQDSVDLVIDGAKGVVRLRGVGSIPIGKQYVLLEILKTLGKHEAKGGVSKGELIRAVWKEPYRPEAHDNKLYFNINRLRKLIEPDFKKPKYILNWKEGYRLAPGLRVQMIDVPDQPDQKDDWSQSGGNRK